MDLYASRVAVIPKLKNLALTKGVTCLLSPHITSPLREPSGYPIPGICKVYNRHIDPGLHIVPNRHYGDSSERPGRRGILNP